MAAFPRRYAVFRYDAELNDFLPPTRRLAAFAHNIAITARFKTRSNPTNPGTKHRVKAAWIARASSLDSFARQ
jgi:hypothetical protein